MKHDKRFRVYYAVRKREFLTVDRHDRIIEVIKDNPKTGTYSFYVKGYLNKHHKFVGWI